MIADAEPRVRKKAAKINRSHEHEDEVNAMRKQLLLVLTGVGLLFAGTTMAAHHAFSSEFDANKPVKLTGTVVKMRWINPHAWIDIAVKRPDGKTEMWMIETGAPNALLRRGFNKNSLPPGTEITVEAFRALDGALRANGRDLTYGDGRVVFLGSSGTGAPYDSPSEAQK